MTGSTTYQRTSSALLGEEEGEKKSTTSNFTAEQSSQQVSFLNATVAYLLEEVFIATESIPVH